MTRCPNWKPQQELKADHLHGLEDYLLSRALLGPSLAPGVEKIDPRLIRIGEPNGDAQVAPIWIAGVLGMTPAGHPVVIDGAAGQELVTGTFQVGAAAASAIVDLFVRVNHPDRNDKYWLDAQVVDMRVPPSNDPQSLYLGRYQWTPTKPDLELVGFPLVRRFAAFPQSNAWTEWTKVLADAVRKLVGCIDANFLARGGPAYAYCAEAYRLATGWPLMPLNDLAASLRYVRTLKERCERPGSIPDSIGELAEVAVAAPPSGADLPGILTNLVGVIALPQKRFELVPGQHVELKLTDPVSIRFLRDLGAGSLEVAATLQEVPPDLRAQDGSLFRKAKTLPAAGTFGIAIDSPGPSTKLWYYLMGVKHPASLRLYYSYS